MSRLVDLQPDWLNDVPPAARPKSQVIAGCIVIPFLLLLGALLLVIKVRTGVSSQIIVPEGHVMLVRALPDENAPLLARFGIGHIINIKGRTEDWRWLLVETWDEQQGWALRPLDILVWQIEAEEKPAIPFTAPQPVSLMSAEMIEIPATTFNMGSPPGLGEADETPARSVLLSPFAIDRTEVTVGRYWECVVAGICQPPVKDNAGTQAHYITNPAFDNHPVIHVPWSEARAYCTWRGKRLPTEAEWEMSAGWNGDLKAKSLWPWGNDGEVGVANAGSHAQEMPASVASFPLDISPNGVLDMGGNVAEWVSDWYKVDYYRLADDSDPPGPTYRRGEGTGKVVRGSSYAGTLTQARTANRGHDDPDFGRATIGFRCAQDR